MDQTMVRMDNPANRTNNAVDESGIRIANTGCARRGITVALAARASGHKLKAYVILKEPTGRIPARAYLQLRIPDIVYIPAGCTGILQPADVYWNKSFKNSLSRQWEEFIRHDERTLNGNLRKPSRQDVLSFVSNAAAEKVVRQKGDRKFKAMITQITKQAEEIAENKEAKLELSVHSKKTWKILRTLLSRAEPKATLRQQIQRFIHNLPGNSEGILEAVKTKNFEEHLIQGTTIYPN
ncbi:hypothetical protein HPB47_003198 [Ixodes persulcatus]|uniref:Uncharacterized protein n=1 Tax=Ixodes persulcatus TaxID=34615 RepID=A0AC60PK81_IXOPE|nr:hypothetical protein HPB47_003198 [Ixodes persulcatus]